MRKLILLAGAVAMTAAGPALAGPGKGKGPSVRTGHSTHVKAKGAKVKTRSDVRVRTDARTRAAGRYGVNDCPPGLVMKRNGCLPPGQAKRIFALNQRVPVGYNFYTDYDDIPLTLRDRYDLAAGQRYIVRDDTVYVVDPTTSLVTRIIDLID